MTADPTAGSPTSDAPAPVGGPIGNREVRAEWDERYAMGEQLWSGQPGHAHDAAVAVRWLDAELAEAPLEPAPFDLVSAQYPVLLRTPHTAAERGQMRRRCRVVPGRRLPRLTAPVIVCAQIICAWMTYGG